MRLTIRLLLIKRLRSQIFEQTGTSKSWENTFKEFEFEKFQ